MALPLPSLALTSVLLGGAVLLCLLWWLSTRRPPGLPPGPGPALPLLGHLHLMPKDPRAQFWKWRRQYGDVFSLYLGGSVVVVLASYSAIREALVTMADVFSDRPKEDMTAKVTKRKGIVGSSGAPWKQQRKASVEILRQMGMGKNVLAEKIQGEIAHYIQAIREHQGAPVDLARMTQTSVSNNICSIIFGKRYEYGDPELHYYLHLFERTSKLMAGTAVLNFIPALRHLPGDPFRGQEVVSSIESIYRFLRQRTKEHHAILKEQGDGQENMDFIYSYLQKQKSQGEGDTSFDDDNLEKTMGDLFVAGTETTSKTILWTLIFFLHHPHVQDECFREISDVTGLHRPPSMSDKPKMTYLEATISEVLRKADVTPLSLAHATARQINFRGYVIPEGAMIIPALTLALRDPDVWGDPENFRPERFIDPDGKLKRLDELIPFSMGRRVCPGESLARMELFLYLATLIQNFRFLPAEQGQLPSLEGIFALTHAPHPFKICAVPRM